MHEIDEPIPILRAEEAQATRVRGALDRDGVRAVNVMGAVGSGKTTVIEALVRRCRRDDLRFAAIAGDVAGDDDCRRFRALGIPAASIETRDECHLTASRVLQALGSLPLGEVDFLFVENVGNLVCPVDFPLGCHRHLVVVSVTEGDDMVRKHPRMFCRNDLVVINKVDLARAVGVEVDRIIGDYARLNPHGTALLTVARSGKGIDAVARALDLLADA